MSEEEKREAGDSHADAMDWQTYKEERKGLIDAEMATSRTYDRYVLILASGALALSLTFLREIARNPRPSSYVLLGFAWALFALTIAAGLSSILCSQKAFRRRLEILEGARAEREYPSREQTCWDRAVGILNLISMFTFLVGSALLLLFAGLNIAPR